MISITQDTGINAKSETKDKFYYELCISVSQLFGFKDILCPINVFLSIRSHVTKTKTRHTSLRMFIALTYLRHKHE